MLSALTQKPFVCGIVTGFGQGLHTGDSVQGMQSPASGSKPSPALHWSGFDATHWPIQQ
jgi:hypothetical protein